MSEHQEKPRSRFLTVNATGLLTHLLIVNLALQLLEGWLSYDIAVESWAEYSIFSQMQMADRLLDTLICNKALACLLLFSIFWFGSKRPRLAAHAMIVTASVSVAFFVDHVQRLLG